MILGNVVVQQDAANVGAAAPLSGLDDVRKDSLNDPDDMSNGQLQLSSAAAGKVTTVEKEEAEEATTQATPTVTEMLYKQKETVMIIFVVAVILAFGFCVRYVTASLDEPGAPAQRFFGRSD